MKKSLRVILLSLLLSIPLALLFLFVYQQFVDAETRSALNRASKRNEIHLRYMEDSIQDTYHTISTTMDYLIRVASDEMLSFRYAGPSATLEHLFTEVAAAQPLLNAILLFDGEGDEILRTSLCAEGSYHTLHALGLTAEQIVATVSGLSPNDLYVNSAFISEEEAPGREAHLYVIMAKGLYEEDELRGVLLFSMKAVDTDELYARYISTEESALSLSVIDGAGHVLETTEGSATFLSADGLSLRPDIWSRMEGPEGAFVSSDMFYKYLTVHPLSESSSHEETRRFLVLLASSDLENLPALRNTVIIRHEYLKYVFSLLLLIGFSLLFTLVGLRRHAREEAHAGNIVSENTPEGVIIRNTRGTVLFVNRALETLSGFPGEQLKASPPQVHLLSKDTVTDRQTRTQGLDKTERKGSEYDDFAWLEGNGYYLLIHLQSEGVYVKKRRISSVQLLSDTRNLSEESFDSFLLDSSAETSVDELPVSVMEAHGPGSADRAVLYIKLTNLHLLEAQYTHLQHYRLEARIRSALRKVLGGEDLLFQYSPDTFMIVLSLHSAGFDSRMASLDAVFTHALERDGIQRPIRFQGGIARSFTGDESDQKDLITQARMALSSQFHYKGIGWLEYNREVHEKLLRYSMIVKKLPSALKKELITVYYQPIFRVADDFLLGGECLVRWYDEELGWIYPDEFIPIIESHGLDVELDRYVLDRAVKYLASLELSESDEFFLSVNICPRDFANEQLIPHITRLLSTYQIPPARLLLEITENTLLDDITLTNEVLRTLRTHDIRIAIDDFGTGYSSLSYINQLEVDVIKIDREFIRKYPEEDDGKLIRSIMRMANDLSMTFYVEGIETEEQLQLTRENKSFAYQGYLRSRPIPEEDFRALCEARASEQSGKA